MFPITPIFTIQGDPGASLSKVPCAASYHSANGGMEMLVVAKSGIQLGGGADLTVATSDGRQANVSEWHKGPSAAEAYVEWQRDGRRHHGYVDAESRKLVQVG